MTFWGHLDALRGVLLRIAAVLAVAFVAMFALMPEIFDAVLLWPCRADFPLYSLFSSDGDFSVELINIKLASQLFIHISTAFNMALVACAPIVIYLLWGFVAPGLYDRERRCIVRAFVPSVLMFYLGVAVGYFLVFPITLRFLATYQLSPLIPNVISIDSYIDNLMGITLIMGIVFQLPLLGWVLGRLGVLRRTFFSRYRRHAIVALLIAAALITPTGDPVTLIVVFVPLYVLWECTASLVPR